MAERGVNMKEYNAANGHNNHQYLKRERAINRD
jgi:hypothetical protein